MANQQPLIAQIDEAEAQLGGLENDLRVVDEELAGLATEREQYRLVEGVCDSLDKLSGLGIGQMFWGDDIDQNEATEHLQKVRARVGVFTERVRIVEDKRRAILGNIAQGHEVLGILEDDLFEIEQEEEERNLEWVVEREIGPLPDRALRLHWARNTEDDRQLRKSLLAFLLVAAVTGVVLPLIDLPLPEPTEELEVPERIVRFIELDEQRLLPAPQPPAPVEPKPEEQKRQEQPQEPEPVLAEQPPPETPAEAPPAPEPPRQRAQAAGILAFRESFSTLADRQPSARLGSQARVGNRGEANSGTPQRAMVTTLVPGSSGGINTAAFSRVLGGEGGGGAIAGVEVGRVASTIDGSPNGYGPGGAATGEPGAGNGALAGRTDEEIQIVFDRYKAALYRLYNRELRNDPTLRGQMVLRLTIEPDGSVSMCELHGTDMNAPTLAAQVVERVKTFAFGAKDVAALTILYPIDFLPAA
jgi:hypothetical protein